MYDGDSRICHEPSLKNDSLFRTTNETLKDYMSKYGEITDCLVMKDDHGKSKCFGFVTFINSIIIDEFMKHRPHIIDGRQVDPKRASKKII